MGKTEPKVAGLEDGVTVLQIKECREPLEAGKDKGYIVSFIASRRNAALPTDFQPTELHF